MKRVLITGVTGYVGGRLVPRLLDRGYLIRVLVRGSAQRLQGRSWSDEVEVAVGDVTNTSDLQAAMENMDAAYYLIHSMSDRPDFRKWEQEAAERFARYADEAGLEHIVYLGGLGNPESDLSEHLRSRHETGARLRSGPVPVTEFRAAVVVGSGSASFEMIRHLAERIPVMICPQWVYTRVQPIAIDDVLTYLVEALDRPGTRGRIVQIGGRDVLTYGEMMMEYAEERGLTRWLVPVPVLSPSLSAYWVHWMTPIPASLARPLIKGLKNEVVTRDASAEQLFPDIEPMGYRESIRRALANLRAGRVETLWADSPGRSGENGPPPVLRQREGMIIERRTRTVDAESDALFDVVTRIGGRRGWLYAEWLWKLRGMLDRLVGGVGFRRGRRDPDQLRVGDVLDFWRVEALEPGELLRLRAEMKLPGTGWLQFEMEPGSDGRSRFVQTAYFVPKGLAGLAYWYLLYPLHALIFSHLADRLVEVAEQDRW